MTTLQNIFKTAMTLSFAFVLFSCNNSGTTTETAAEATPATEAAPATNATLFNLMVIKHPVADYAKWRPEYDAHDSIRQAYGIAHFAIARGSEDANAVMVIDKISDVQKAKDFTALPELKEAMQKAGVTGAPEFSFLNVIRNDDAVIAQKERVMITHRVKDFDAWLKVFDAEGTAKRLEHGIIDRGMARGVDDPNVVFLMFAMADKEKAMARMNSEELKNTMTEAGVEGAPQVEFYTLAD